MESRGEGLERDAGELVLALAEGRLSAAELMAATLGRIDALNPRFNAIVALRDRETLMAEARASDAERRQGGARGPLHGLPMAIKDFQSVAGLPTSKGTPLLKDAVAAVDSVDVRRLRAAGALFIGKTNVPELGLGSYSTNPLHGPTRNAYDERLTSGGSSSGAAVALALRMVALADGSDVGGSLRNPAGWNNVYGFRPSYGLIARDDLDAWAPGLGVLGPMARSVADLALLISVQAGHDEVAPFTYESDGARFRLPLETDVKGRRIAWLGDCGGAIPYEPGVLELARSALNVFEGLGCVVEEARPDFDFGELWGAFVTLRSFLNAPLLEFYRDPEKRALLPETAIYEVEKGLKLSAYDVSAASQARTRWSAALRRFFARYDFFALPTAQVFAFPVESCGPMEIAGRGMASYHEWMQSAVPATMAGAPAAALPAGFDAEGRAMGVQLVGRPRDDFALLQLAHAYDVATRWPRRRPPPAVGG